jgi:hypothetical protein
VGTGSLTKAPGRTPMPPIRGERSQSVLCEPSRKVDLLT